MCFGGCARSTGYKLLVLALLCIVANILLYFPNGETRFASEHHLSKYVECLHGILGGGFLVLIAAAVFIGLHKECCACAGHRGCGKGCVVLSSVLAACVGILGSGYCIIVSALGLSQGPYCFTTVGRNWIYPFTESSGGYLLEYNKWSQCQEPQNIVQWNVTLFSILLVLGGIEFILCSVHIIRAILGGICGLCSQHEESETLLHHVMQFCVVKAGHYDPFKAITVFSFLFSMLCAVYKKLMLYDYAYVC